MAKQSPKNRLIIRVMAKHALSSHAGIADAVAFLMNPERIGRTAKSATVWVDEAIAAVRNAPGENKWKDATDDEIAADILAEVEKRESAP